MGDPIEARRYNATRHDAIKHHNEGEAQMLHNFITRTLDSLGIVPTSPVFARSPSRGNMFLGMATTHGEAEALGALAGMSCRRISRARLDGDDRTFFVLH